MERLVSGGIYSSQIFVFIFLLLFFFFLFVFLFFFPFFSCSGNAVVCVHIFEGPTSTTYGSRSHHKRHVLTEW